MKTFTSILLVSLALIGGTSCDTVGEVPELSDLRGRYGNLASGTFRLYDASLDSTYSGAATFYPADNLGSGGVLLESPDFDDATLASGVSVSIKSEGFDAPEVGDEFDIGVGYSSPEGNSGGIDGRAGVTAVSADGDISGVFWARVKDDNTFRIGAPRVIEGGFSATLTAR